jgi:cytochrome c-type biogenesis protein CcsB
MLSSQLSNIVTIGYHLDGTLRNLPRHPQQGGGGLKPILAYLGFPADRRHRPAVVRVVSGAWRGRSRLLQPYESVVFFALTILLIYIIIDLKYKQRAVGAFVIPFAFLAMAWAQLQLNDAIEPLVPALQSNWLTYHVITCFLGYAAFAVACGVSIMYLIKAGKEEKSASGSPAGGILAVFPSTRILDDINYKSIMIGFPLLSLGIITGAAWANYAWGTYWSWDPKETWSLIVWFIYAAFLHARFTRGWVGKKAAWLSIIGFAATIFCYLGVNLVLSGLHSYGG